MANEAGPGCQDLANNDSNSTMVSGDVSSTAGDITTYRFQAVDDSQAWDVEWSMQQKQNGTFDYVAGTDTGQFADVRTLDEPSANCREAVAGDHFTPTTEASVGDYVSCWYAGQQELAISGGTGTLYRIDNNYCDQTGWTPSASNASYDCAVGVDITAAAGGATASSKFFHRQMMMRS